MKTPEQVARAFIGADALGGIGYGPNLELATRAIAFDRAHRAQPAGHLDIDEITAVLEFAERGATRELGAIDPRMRYTQDETNDIRRRFENYYAGRASLKALIEGDTP